MKSRKIIGSMLVLAVGVMMASAENINGINMDFQWIGNAGNPADSTSYGSVGYTYRIGTTEVSLSQFQGAAGAGDGDENHWVALGAANAPAVKISFLEAARFCNFLTSSNVNVGAYTISGSQVTGITAHEGAAMDVLIGTYGTVYVLPTESEWYKAAYYSGSGYTTYANGSGTVPVQGVDANYGAAAAWAIGAGAVEQNGTLNMMGNVWEWTESAFDGSLGLPVAENIAFRGGAYNAVATTLSLASRGQDTYTLEHQSVGMRVVAIPEPGTISLMSLSTIGLFATRGMRRRKRIGKTLVPIRREHRCDSFKTEAEWREELARVEDGEDYFQMLSSVFMEGSVGLWLRVRQSCRRMDKAFWNAVVRVHELTIEKSAAPVRRLRSKAIGCLDVFLARIMK